MRSVIQTNEECFWCGSKRNLECHHVFFGKNRKLADDDGMTVLLCDRCHRGTYGVHGREGHDMDMQLKKIAQIRWMQVSGRTKEAFVGRYGKNYLD